jgi:hypothetical protein
MQKKIIAILGLGPSLKLFRSVDFDLTIGVNDIWRYYKTDAVVCLDNFNAFTADRLRVIRSCTPEYFYSQKVLWDTMKGFRKIELLPGYPDSFVQFETKALHKSYCSPFVAAQIAYKDFRASEIHLFGVDLISHPHLDKALCAKIKIHFRNLSKALKDKSCELIVHGNGILKEL